jgi:hypothetical protein
VKPHAFLKLDRQGSGSKYMDMAQWKCASFSILE